MNSMICDHSIVIRNASIDPISSVLLEKLIEVIKRKHDIPDGDMTIEYTSIPNAKCDFTLAVTIVTSVATGILSAAIWDYIKLVYARYQPEKNKKEWKLDVEIERPIQISVGEDGDTGTITIEINDKK